MTQGCCRAGAADTYDSLIRRAASHIVNGVAGIRKPAG